MDTRNRFLVGAQGDKINILNPPVGPITREDALLFAAWLVAIADVDDIFAHTLEAVEST